MKGNTMEDTRTISADSYFGKKNITKKEFVQRWSAPALTIWTLFLDHGTTTEERLFGSLVHEKAEDLAGRAFEKFYGEEKND
tara:strand:+ start:462 stop:707 length:246 start_codon:yes stop_codon:yes gene_type:complete